MLRWNPCHPYGDRDGVAGLRFKVQRRLRFELPARGVDVKGRRVGSPEGIAEGVAIGVAGRYRSADARAGFRVLHHRPVCRVAVDEPGGPVPGHWRCRAATSDATASASATAASATSSASSCCSGLGLGLRIRRGPRRRPRRRAGRPDGYGHSDHIVRFVGRSVGGAKAVVDGHRNFIRMLHRGVEDRLGPKLSGGGIDLEIIAVRTGQ